MPGWLVMPLEIEIGLLNVTAPMQDAHNLDPIRNRAVKGKIFADHNTSDACSDILPRNAYARLGCDEFPPFLYPVEQPVCGGWIVRRYAGPDFDKVFFGLRTPQNDRHCQAERLFACANRRRASALISAIELYRPGPLSIPSCTRARSSSSV